MKFFEGEDLGFEEMAKKPAIVNIDAGRCRGGGGVVSSFSGPLTSVTKV
jgi:hypothetical protein